MRQATDGPDQKSDHPATYAEVEIRGKLRSIENNTAAPWDPTKGQTPEIYWEVVVRGCPPPGTWMATAIDNEDGHAKPGKQAAAVAKARKRFAAERRASVPGTDTIPCELLLSDDEHLAHLTKRLSGQDVIVTGTIVAVGQRKPHLSTGPRGFFHPRLLIKVTNLQAMHQQSRTQRPAKP